jgi:polysaccharide export outer membrane protein
MTARIPGPLLVLGLALACCLAGSGCHHFAPVPPPTNIPNEKAKMALPTYVIEPPDVLQINAIQLVPKPPYKIKPLDALRVMFPASPESLKKDEVEDLAKTGRFMSANYIVEPEGTINLGPIYGRVPVFGMTIDEARAAVDARIRQQTKKELVDAGRVALELVHSQAIQQILGFHLVRPDGTVSLGSHGEVFVTGMTIADARAAIEEHLSRSVLRPEISVDVVGFNSKVYYVILDGAGFGEQVYRMPSYGNETVLDAISHVYGLPAVAARSRVWIARPGPDEHAPDQIVPVQWTAITRGGAAKMNYQVFPGDRIFVQAKPIVAFDNYLALVIAPVQRMMGVAILGAGTFNTLKFLPGGGGGGLGGGGGGTGAVGR